MRAALVASELATQPDQHTKYVYSGNNPLKYIDPDDKDITVFYEQPSGMTSFGTSCVLSSQPARNRQVRAWCTSFIHEMLRNERYRGVFVLEPYKEGA